MNTFRPRRPSSVESSDDLIDFPFENTEQLLKIEHVSRCKDVHNFHQFSIDINKYSEWQGMLLVEFDGGTRWFVLGYIKNIEDIDLPRWR